MYERTIQMRKQNRHKKTANYRRLSGIELPWTLREGLSLDIKRLSWINNSQVSEQEERILKSSNPSSSNPNLLFTRFLKRLSISAFPSPVHTLFKFALKSTDFAMLLILISTFDLSFAPLNASLLSFLSRIKFLRSWDLVLYTYLSVDAVPRRMWVKPCAIYTPEYRNTWDSLL
jgi:hypothetical protein